MIVHGVYNCAGASVSFPENIPPSTLTYLILARDPDPGQESEVSYYYYLFVSNFQ